MALLSDLPPVETPSRLRVHLLTDPKATERGMLYRRGDGRFLLAWSRIARAFAAEIGEAGSGLALHFHLVLEPRGAECVTCRLEAAPGEGAIRLARAILLGIGEGRVDPCIRSLAEEGVACRGHADGDVFGDAVLEAVRYAI